MKSQARGVSARLVDLPYAPRTASRHESAKWNLSVRAAAREIEQRDSSAYTRGRALLLLGNTEAAVEQLRLAAETDDPEALSDLGAALVAEAEELDAWEPAIDAIVATRRAIERAPELASAHFNLALALERIGLTTEARGAFDASARLESDSPWAAEAMKRASSIPRRAATDLWKVTEQRLKATSDPAVRKALVLQDPYLARINAEGPYLTTWADARVRGRLGEARTALDLARTIATILRNASGERLALDAVAAIDRAESRGNAMELARAHLTYLEGRLARKNRDETKAINLLSSAAAQLAVGESPLQYVALYYSAGALYEQGRINEALILIESLEAQGLEPRGYRGLTAQLGWEHGICLEVRGKYAEALDIFDRSRAIARAGNEHDLAARFDGLASEALDYLGDSNKAWRRRRRALRAYALSGRVDIRKAVALTSAAQVQMAARNWSRAKALLDYAIPLATEAGDAVVTAQAFAKRSVTRDELHERAGAARDRMDASRWARRVEDPARAPLQIEIDIAEGVAQRAASPRQAITQFTRAIQLLSSSGQTSLLPRLFFERARAQEALGDFTGADSDLRSGLRVVEQWEGSVFNIEQRAAMSIWSDAIRRDLIAHALARADVASAFAYADSRYSTANLHTPLTDSTQRTISLREMQRVLARNVAILEFVVIRERLIAFVIRAGAAHAFRLPSNATRIAALAEAMRQAPDEILPDAGAALYEVLLAPIRDSLRGTTTLVIVPTPELSAIPFGALRDGARNRYLIEDESILLATTAGAAIAFSRSIDHSGNRMIAIGSDAFDRRRHPELLPLPNARREALDIASQWRSRHAWTGIEATAERLRRELPEAAVIHYAGHIIGRGADARLLLAPSNGKDSLSARDVTGLPLHSRVVVLAGCRGSGVSSPQTIIGDMASGFLGAGAKAVITNATDVDDAESPRTMRRVHSFLIDGFDAAEAVQRATMLDLAEGRRTPLSIRLMVHGGSHSVVRH